MSKTIKIGGISVETGTKKSGILTIGGRPALGLDLPFTVINGASSGPILLITAGNHGSEYAGIDAAIRLRSSLDAGEISGAVFIVPIVNLPAFQERTNRVCPIDGINVNRVYPGKPMGTIGYLIAYTVFNQFVLKADFAIDLHGGDLYESIVPSIIQYESDDQGVNKKSESLARDYANGGKIEFIWKISSGGIRGVEEDIRQMTFPRGTLIAEAVERGIPAIQPEAGELGRLEEKYVSVHINGVLNVMKSLRMIEGVEESKIQHKTVSRSAFLYAKRGGLFHLFIKPGVIASKGEILGQITSIDSKTVETITAPTKGVVLCAQTNPVKNVGDKLLLWGEI